MVAIKGASKKADLARDIIWKRLQAANKRGEEDTHNDYAKSVNLTHPDCYRNNLKSLYGRMKELGYTWSHTAQKWFQKEWLDEAIDLIFKEK